MRRCRSVPAVLSLAALVVATGLPAAADGLRLSTSNAASPSRSALFKQQAKLLDTRGASQYEHSDRLKPKAGRDGPIPAWRGSYRGEYLELARAAARRHNVPEDLFLRLVQRESNWNHGAISVKGATGLAQLMPDTAKRLGVDETDPGQNLEGGARYLRMMYDRFGSWRLALAAYNAGPEAVQAAGGVPNYDETQAYVIAILGS